MRLFLRIALAVFFIAAGVNHFRVPEMYLGIMPPMLPWPRELVWISGVAEIAGGIGVLIPALRRAAAWGLIALLVAVFPANIYAALHGMVINGHDVPAWTLWARLPLQFVFIGWVAAACLPRKTIQGVPGTYRKRSSPE
ncbi:MAG TPA: DoxX family membrane protein [Chthoniobacterales bacterium]|jgi:uncharacterized membrane protein|nr:DoxX family membrane protein [Chthoniobacterales bacterium]